jgi:hypothetical protein
MPTSEPTTTQPAPPAPPAPPADLREEIRAAVQQSIEGAQEGTREAAQAARDAGRAAREQAQMDGELARARAEAGQLHGLPGGPAIARGGDGTLRITTPEGKTITIDRGALPPGAREAIAAQAGVPMPMLMEGPSPMLLQSIVMIVALIVSAFVLAPIARAIGRRMDRRGQEPAAAPAFGARFDRLEQAREAIAIEVERVSEAQRYSARLLTERLPERLPEPRYAAPQQSVVTAAAPAAPDARG